MKMAGGDIYYLSVYNFSMHLFELKISRFGKIIFWLSQFGTQTCSYDLQTLTNFLGKLLEFDPKEHTFPNVLRTNVWCSCHANLSIEQFLCHNLSFLEFESEDFLLPKV